MMTVWKLLMISSFLRFGFGEIDMYRLECFPKDVQLYHCGSHRPIDLSKSNNFYSPVIDPMYTALYHRYPDVDIRHLGVDLIGDRHILPAQNGHVVKTCVLACGSYGQYVIVQHQEKLFTLYAHLSQVFVTEGESVHRLNQTEGSLLGYMGNSGASEGTHLHFEVRTAEAHDYQYRMNPVSFLTVHIDECSNMFGLYDALNTLLHPYHKWYGVGDTGQIIVKT